MPTRTIPIAEASAEQLHQFATKVLGLSIHPQSKAETIRAKMAPVYDKDSIEVEDAPVREARQDAAPSQPGGITPEQRDQQFVTIIISKGEKPEEQQPVPVSVNGRMMWIERGKPQKVRYPYYHVLKNATRKVYHPSDEKGNMTEEEVPAYPFSIVGGEPVAA